MLEQTVLLDGVTLPAPSVQFLRQNGFPEASVFAQDPDGQVIHKFCPVTEETMASGAYLHFATFGSEYGGAIYVSSSMQCQLTQVVVLLHSESWLHPFTGDDARGQSDGGGSNMETHPPNGSHLLVERLHDSVLGAAHLSIPPSIPPSDERYWHICDGIGFGLLPQRQVESKKPGDLE